jgi:transcriptional regulator with XRE-family HTH domain
MKRNNRLEKRRRKISKDVDLFVNQSFDIVDRIHEILAKQGKEQKDLAKALGKKESEISKWMSGTHNFTIKTIAKIEAVLNEPIIHVSKTKSPETSKCFFIISENYKMKKSRHSSIISNSIGQMNIKPFVHSGSQVN